MALIALFTGSVWLARATGLAAGIANVLHKIYYQIRGSAANNHRPDPA